jgi:hypothetical protein
LIRNRKKELLNHFDHVYATPVRPLSNTSIRYWQSAAALFLLGCLTLSFFYMKNAGKISPSNLVAHTDTVYMESTPELIKVYDTIYLEHEPSQVIQKVQKRNNQLIQEPVLHEQTALPELEGIATSTIHDISKERNRTRHRSIRSDSIISRYGFVTL